MNPNTKTFKKFYKTFKPPNNWDNFLGYSKDTSLYYELLVKQYGREFADQCWTKRLDLDRMQEHEGFTNAQLYNQVKNYKPRDPLCLIGDLSWGYNEINLKYANN